MAAEALKTKGLLGSSPVAFKAFVANLMVFAAGLAVTLYIGRQVAAGFTVGFLLGAFNMYWLLRIARRGVKMAPEKAGRYVAGNYYARFLLTALIFVLLISRNILTAPWPPLLGLSAAIFTTIAVMIVSLTREEAL